MEQQNKKRVALKIGAIYGRYSTHEQDSGSSKESQISRGLAKAKELGIIILPHLIFFDEAMSGTRDDRPEFMRMMAAAKKEPPEFQYLICEDTSRFSRDALHAQFYKHELRKRKIQIIYTSQNFGDSPEGKLTEGIMEQLDAFYSDQVRQKTLHHMTDNIKSGFSNGGNPPFGYKKENIWIDKSKEKKRVKWVPDPDTAPIVKKAFELRATGWGPARICESLSWYTKPNGKKINVGNLNYWFRTCADTYAGCMVWNKTTDRGRSFNPREEWIIVEDVNEGIIPKELA